MSGRKNYSYRLTAARLAREQVASAARAIKRAEAQRQREEQLLIQREVAKRRSEEIRQRLADARQRTQDEVKSIAVVRSQHLSDVQAVQQQKNADKLAEASERTRSALDAMNRDVASSSSEQLLEIAEELGLSPGAIREFSDVQRPDEGDSRLIDACTERQQLNEEIEDGAASLKAWLDTLSKSDEVKHFATHRLQSWRSMTETLLGTDVEKSNAGNQLRALQQAILEAEEIEAAAIDTAEKFAQRNSVLGDILESLQEAGFFVQDPEYLDPMRPDQAVIIRANRADQTMVANVALDARVESDWQGVHGEYCTDAFFDYVKQMKLRGVEITPNNPELVPKLKQQDALNLPNTEERRSGNE